MQQISKVRIAPKLSLWHIVLGTVNGTVDLVASLLHRLPHHARDLMCNGFGVALEGGNPLGAQRLTLPEWHVLPIELSLHCRIELGVRLSLRVISDLAEGLARVWIVHFQSATAASNIFNYGVSSM